MRIAAWILLGAVMSGFAAAETVVIERDSKLLSEPRTDARVTATVKQGTTGDAGTKKGPWVQVKTSAGTGWILSFNLRYGTAPSPGSATDTSTISRLVAPRNQPNVTATIGTRGLDKEALQQAKFDAQQLAAFEKYHTSEAQAKASAAANGLKAQKVEYLDQK